MKLKDIGTVINAFRNGVEDIDSFREAWERLTDKLREMISGQFGTTPNDVDEWIKEKTSTASATNQETAATRENTAATQQGTAANEAYAASEGSVTSATNASTAAINAETVALQRNTEARAAANAQDTASDILDITPNVSTSPTVTAPSVSQIGNVSQELAEGTTQINQQTSAVFLRILCEKRLKSHADSYIMKITKGKHTDRRCAPKSLFATK